MRNARRTTLGIAAALLLCAAPLPAQTVPGGLAAESVDPQGDSVFLQRIRERLDAVRTGQNRPVVALVLSGGGAKGAAEVGAIKYIEELGIPVDFVCGTSIGGLIGGFYALGYDADEIMEIIRAQDWDVMLTDRIAPEYIPYQEKMDRATYLFSIPFRVRSAAAQEQEAMPAGGPRQQIRDAIRARSASDELSGSLPAGYAYGFNVGNLLSSLSAGYQDSISFSRLPVPFACVAGDIASGDAKYWGDGEIVTAMRSSMSVPGLFNPVRVGKMVLVDGGVRNNYPADIARAVGADYVIGIELSDAAPDYDEIRNLGNILGRFIPMLGKETFRHNVALSDVFIKPSLPEFDMMSFRPEAFDTMYVRGYAAAAAQRDALLALRERTGRRPQHRAVNLARHPVRIASIEYEGLDDATALRMARLTGLTVEETLDKQRIDEAMSRLQATDAFETVSYSLYGEREPFRLVFHCTPSPVHSFGLGLRVDTEEGAALLFKLGLFSNRLSGSKLDLTARIGQNLQGTLHYALDLSDLPTLNFAATASSFRSRLEQDGTRYDASHRTHREEFYVSGLDWTRFDLRAGIAYKAYRIDTGTDFARLAEHQGIPLHAGYLGTYLSGDLYTLDDHHFPTRGISLGLRADYDFIRTGATPFTPILSGRLDLRAAIPLSGRVALLPELRLRSFSHFGEDIRDGLLHTTYLGGTLAGRYFEGQTPFFALSRTEAVGDYLASASAALRFQLTEPIFVSALAGVFYDDDKIPGLFSSARPDGWGLGIEAACNTIGGPIRLGLHWSDRQGWGAQLTIGFDF